MDRESLVYRTYAEILEKELVCAMGCTEPAALAYCAAAARAALGALPEKILVEASGNIIKNVKSVVVPNTGGRRGIAAAACAGALCGDEKAGLQVLSRVTAEDAGRLGPYMDAVPVEVRPLASEHVLDMVITVYAGSSRARVRIANEHTNIVLIERDGKVILEKDPAEKAPAEDLPDYSLLSVQGIYDFAASCVLEDVQPVLDRMIKCNTAIAREGLRKDYGANIGKVLLKTGDDLHTRARAWAAAGSDARMNGSELPVVICSGSGNQGLTASLPVIAHTIVNALAISSGIVCDGAKSSCAAKIAMAVETGIFGYEMFRSGQQFYGGDGLVVKGVENSIAAFGRLARVGMSGTDREIIRMMTGEGGSPEEGK